MRTDKRKQEDRGIFGKEMDAGLEAGFLTLW